MRGVIALSREVVDRFVETLRRLEEDGDVEPMVEVHSEDCEVGNVAVPEVFIGLDGAREFWTDYRRTFGEMRSSFRNTIVSGDKAALEWTTEGTENEKTVSYDGVSILEIEGDRVRRFRAYFNAADLSRQVVD
jgi:ketosteroid isomerase-like protein